MKRSLKFPNVFRINLFSLLGFIVFLHCFSCSITFSDEMENYSEFQHKNYVSTVSSSLNKFTLDLFMALSKERTGNIFFSPFSVSAALSMVYIGAGGNTEQEVKKVLNYSDKKEVIQRAYKNMISDYQNVVPQYQLHTSNMAYMSDKLTVNESFIDTLKEIFLATTKLVNFEQSEAVQQEINSAVEKETNSKIKDIIPSGLLSSRTRMVLVNAIYFKGLWLHQFDPKMTEEKPFWTKADVSINIPMMSIKKDFGFADMPNLDAKLLSMKYQGGRISFIILLPNQRDGLPFLEQKLINEDLSQFDKEIFVRKTLVSIPKFKMEEALDLSYILKSMGLNDLFSPSTCDLSGIANDQGLFVTNVLHKAFLEVNEEGSEAAAATAVVMSRSMVMRQPELRFIADHPFMFYIRDWASHNILFTGRYIQPVNV